MRRMILDHTVWDVMILRDNMYLKLIPVSDKIKVKEIRGKNGIKLLMMIHD